MTRQSARIISKIGALAIIIGYFLPVYFSYNGFGIAEFISAFGLFSSGVKIYAYLIWIVFIAACINIILLFLLASGKEINFSIDWLLISISIICGLIIWNKLKGLGEAQRQTNLLLGQFGLNNRANDAIPIGRILIIIGWIFNILFLIIASFLQDQVNRIIHKKDLSKKDALICNICKKTFSSGYKSCPYCSSNNIEPNPDAPDENKETPLQNIQFLRPINSDSMKKCEKCGEKVREDIFKCPKCKGESFI